MFLTFAQKISETWLCIFITEPVEDFQDGAHTKAFPLSGCIAAWHGSYQHRVIVVDGLAGKKGKCKYCFSSFGYFYN